MDSLNDMTLAQLDPEIQAVLDAELGRQGDTLEMIASENFVPRAVLEAQGWSLLISTPRATRAAATTVAASSWTSRSLSPSNARSRSLVATT